MVKFFLCLLCTLSLSLFAPSANAAPRLSACEPQGASSTSGPGLDGSNCDSQLVCGDAKICTYPTEVGCVGSSSGNSGCGIGQKCMADAGGTAASGAGGICQTAAGGSAENNAIGDILCNAYKIATGKIGRGVIVAVLFVTGISFYLGKVQWGTIVAIVIGAGLTFGAPAIVSVLVGKNFLC